MKGAFVSGNITMGFTTIVVQRISKARVQSETEPVLGAAALLFLIQAAVVSLLAVTRRSWVMKTTHYPLQSLPLPLGFGIGNVGESRDG